MTASEGQKALHRAIETRVFEAAYLFVGDDDFRKADALAQLIAGAVDPATRDFNLEVRRGSEISAESLGSILATPPMLADRRTVVIRDAGSLKKDAKAELERYLERPAPDVVVVLTQPAGENPDPRFGRATPVQFDRLNGPRLAKWIAHRSETAFGSKITPAAVDLLQASVGDDCGQLNVELEKLSTFAGGAEIDDQAVAAVVGVRREETLPALLDAIAARDAVTALRILPGLLEQPKSSGVFIVMVLGMQVLGTAFARARLAARVPAGRIESELKAMIKESAGYPGRSWNEAAASWVATAPLWTDRALRDASAALHAADRALKDTGRTSEEGVLQGVILSVCEPASRRAA